MRLLIDMNLSPRWAEVLTESGYEAGHWASVGRADATDREIMNAARRMGAVIVTHDLDFGTMLAASGESAPSVVQLRSDDLRPETAAPALTQALQVCRADLEIGALLTVDAARYRVSLLPLRT